MRNLSTVERAFELAREGRCRHLSDLSRQLSAEGYSSVQFHLAGSSIRRQLLALIRQDGDDQPLPPTAPAPS